MVGELTTVGVVLGILVILVLGSIIWERLRTAPKAPERLDWAPDIPIRYLTVNGSRIRYIAVGQGPALILLHTLRTQLDIFQKVIPPLARDFTVYAVDYPGHGWSDIPQTDFTPQFFSRFVTGFLEALNLDRVLLAGVSIGGTIPLMIAAEGNPRVRGIVSINPFDYGKRGADRANVVAKVIFTLAAIPVVGETVMRLRNRLVEGRILEGGVTRREVIPPALAEQVFVSGLRPGHYRGFLNLIRHMPLWSRLHQTYSGVRVPVLLLYGDQDWSRVSEREKTARAVPGARLVTVENGGHFLPLDRPDAVVHHIRAFAESITPDSAFRAAP
jgi:pimeloyl-ACP methyl ester carboxylesterase